jgi:plastocyanin
VSALAACGGSSGSGSTSTGGAAATSTSAASTSTSATSASAAGTAGNQQVAQELIATEADFSIALDKDVVAGDYVITVVNRGKATHDLVIEQGGNDVAASGTIAPGQSTTVAVNLTPGEYIFYCSVGNHRAMGMELTVQVT